MIIIGSNDQSQSVLGRNLCYRFSLSQKHGRLQYRRTDEESEISLPKFCCMHANPRVKSKVTVSKDKSWTNFIQCCILWRNVVLDERNIARDSLTSIAVYRTWHRHHTNVTMSCISNFAKFAKDRPLKSRSRENEVQGIVEYPLFGIFFNKLLSKPRKVQMTNLRYAA